MVSESPVTALTFSEKYPAITASPTTTLPVVTWAFAAVAPAMSPPVEYPTVFAPDGMTSYQVHTFATGEALGFHVIVPRSVVRSAVVIGAV